MEGGCASAASPSFLDESKFGRSRCHRDVALRMPLFAFRPVYEFAEITIEAPRRQKRKSRSPGWTAEYLSLRQKRTTAKGRRVCESRSAGYTVCCTDANVLTVAFGHACSAAPPAFLAFFDDGWRRGRARRGVNVEAGERDVAAAFASGRHLDWSGRFFGRGRSAEK